MNRYNEGSALKYMLGTPWSKQNPPIQILRLKPRKESRSCKDAAMLKSSVSGLQFKFGFRVEGVSGAVYVYTWGRVFVLGLRLKIQDLAWGF